MFIDQVFIDHVFIDQLTLFGSIVLLRHRNGFDFEYRASSSELRQYSVEIVES